MEEKEKQDFSPEGIAKKYGIDLDKLKQEQIKLAKTLELKDNIDFKLADKIGAIGNTYFKNKIVSGAVILSPSMEILFQEYSSDILRFPYISGFRAYRELPAMIEALGKLDEKPDVVFVEGHGISHPRLGLASHFSIASGIPTIGVSDSLLPETVVEGEDILLNGKKVGKVLKSKTNSKPLYVSPGNLISIKTAYELAKKFIVEPHKFPEPIHIVRKYAKKTRDELFMANSDNHKENSECSGD